MESPLKGGMNRVASKLKGEIEWMASPLEQGME